ncbi:MAG: hypothetical protein QOH46_3375 [Solirubrobacteraceae bacterium]|nr:hypothetical protein [Solirubrobacteraceae bacterium]
MEADDLSSAPRPTARAGAASPAITSVPLWTPLIAGSAAWAAYAAHVLTGFAGDTLAAVLYVTAVCGAAIGSATGARVRSGGPWILLALAIGGYGATSVAYTLIPDAAISFPTLYDAGLIAFYPLALVGFAGFVRGHVARAGWLDASIGALVVAAVGATAIQPLIEGAGGIRLAGQLFYVLADLGFIGILLAAYTLSGLRDGTTLLFLAGGAALLAAGDAMYVLEVADGRYVATAPSTLAWSAGLLLMAVAPYLRLRPLRPASSPWAKIAIPGVSAVVVLPIDLLAKSMSPQHVLAGAALTLVVVRLMMSLRENSSLLASLHGAATTDRLTGLANRQLLFDRLENALARRARRGSLLAVLFIDLDEFKAINDAHGHDIGDRVLVDVADRLRYALRSGDTVARHDPAMAGPRPRDTVGRLGGDEFVILLEGLEDDDAAVRVTERILEEIRAPLVIGEHTMFLDASIGITQSHVGDERGPTELLRDGDTAMYEAKRAGRHRYQVFEREMHEKAVARTELTHALRTAVASGQLRVLYQPQVDLGSGRMTGVEALVRWEHPQHGLLGPDRFIPLAESSGLIADIDDWVLREACAQLRRWDDAGLPRLDMAVNVSSRRLGTGDLAATVAAVLRETAIEARRLEVEVTETVAIEQDSAGVEAITGVRALGVSVAIDDFGMGHSALSRLQTFPVDRLKIDRSFVAPLVEGAERGSLADAMIAMGQSLGLRVVAEGVETKEHLRALRALGCPTAQGYLFSKPVPADGIERIARTGLLLAPLETEPVQSPAAVERSATTQERLVRSLLAELQRVTGLETTYLTRVDWAKATQNLTHVRNAGTLDIPEGLTVNWSDTVCRRALEQGVTYTDDVPGTFPGSSAAEELGLQTYVSVPLVNADGEIEGTLCGASSTPVPLGHTAVKLMERFAHIIAQGVSTPRPRPRPAIAVPAREE